MISKNGLLKYILMAFTLSMPMAMKAQNATDSIYQVTTQRAQFPGGNNALMSYISELIILPNTNEVNSPQARTIVKAVVEKDGTLTQTEIARSCGETEIDHAILQTIAMLPKHIPAQNGQELVRSYIFIPVAYSTIVSLRSQRQEQLLQQDSQPKNEPVVKMPEFPGGTEAFMNYLSNNLQYPHTAKMEGAQGRCICQFIIQKDGHVGEVNVVRGSGSHSLDNEAVRLLKAMPNWTPGTKDGKAMEAEFSVPIVFTYDQKARKATKASTDEKYRWDKEICLHPDTEARFPGEKDALQAYINEYMQYPEPVGREIEGSPCCRFLVDTDGSLHELEIIRSSGSKMLDDEMLDGIRKMPHWLPAQIGGKAVASRHTLTIRFHQSNKTRQKRIYNRTLNLCEEEYPFAVQDDEMDQVPMLTNGIEALKQFVHNRFYYDAHDKPIGAKDRMVCSFVVTEDGKIEDVKIVQSSGDMDMDSYVEREFANMNSWRPGMLGQTAISVRYTIQIPIETEKMGEIIVYDTIPMNRTISDTISSDGIPFTVVETMPEFPGGQVALFKYLSENVHYPIDAQKKGIQGRSICQFIVNKDGSISDVEIIRSAGNASLDKEAIRVINSMPSWKPGVQRGKPVRVKFTVPVNFKLQ